MQHCRQHRDIFAGRWAQVNLCARGGFGFTRVDHDERHAIFDLVGEASRGVLTGHTAGNRHHGVAAKHQPNIGVGKGLGAGFPVAEHGVGNIFAWLVNGGAGKNHW